jgi:hypothetical protein
MNRTYRFHLLLSEVTILNLWEINIHPALPKEEPHFQHLMQQHHYLGALPKIGETLWYIASWHHDWIALLSFSTPAWKCKVRDQWIGWDFRHQYDRLHLLTNNSRFLILPPFHIPNLASRILSLCQKRLPEDWQEVFGHPLLLLETFVDPERFQGTVYKAANWVYAGNTKGFRRIRRGYSATAQSPKMVFLKPLQPNVQSLLSQSVIEPIYHKGDPKMMLKAEQMRSLPYFFRDIPDPRRTHGRRHSLATVLAIAAGAILCGMRGYQAISDWADSLGQKARERFGCRRENGRYVVPSLTIFRNMLIRVDPLHLDHALQNWNQTYAKADESLAIDGKTMCNAIDDQGRQTHIMSVVGHQSKTCYTQKKSVHCP